MSKITDAINNAIAWLQDHPENHIRGVLARNSDGFQCRPNDPDAQCFCVLGRISKELDLHGYPVSDGRFANLLATHDVEEDQIYDLNDKEFDGTRDPVACSVTGQFNHGNPAVFDYIRERLL